MMKFITKLILITSLAMLFISCENSREGDPVELTPIAFETVNASPNLQVSDPHTQVFRSWNRWSEFWGEHPECNNGCVVPAPYVDFETSIVVAIFWGLEGWGCVDYADRILSIGRTEDATVVDLRDETIDQGCDVMTYAYLFVTIDRADVPVIFTGAVPR